MPFTGYNHFGNHLVIANYGTLPVTQVLTTHNRLQQQQPQQQPQHQQQHQQQQQQQQPRTVSERNRVAGAVTTTTTTKAKKKQKRTKHKKQQQHVPKLQRKVPTDIVALGIATLPEQVKAFTLQKRALVEENRRLQALLATARKMIEEKGAHRS